MPPYTINFLRAKSSAAPHCERHAFDENLFVIFEDLSLNSAALFITLPYFAAHLEALYLSNLVLIPLE